MSALLTKPICDLFQGLGYYANVVMNAEAIRCVHVVFLCFLWQLTGKHPLGTHTHRNTH